MDFFYSYIAFVNLCDFDLQRLPSLLDQHRRFPQMSLLVLEIKINTRIETGTHPLWTAWTMVETASEARVPRVVNRRRDHLAGELGIIYSI